MSYIDLICKISNPEKMLEMNINNIYLLSNIGIKKYDDNDDIGIQIKNLKTVEYKFNINEVFIFRTFLDTKIILYLIMEDEMYILNSRKKIINAVIYIDNYLIVFFENNEIEIINYRKFKYLKLVKNTVNLDDYLSLLIKVIEENLVTEDMNVRTNVKPIALPHSKVNIQHSPSFTNINMDIDSLQIICERIWTVFSLQEESCYCFSIIKDENRLFQYLININKQKIIFDNIFNLVKFLKKEFYEPIKLCSYLI